MSTIVTRSGKGSPLSHVEVDANFTNLNTDKIQSGNTVAALTITSATINGGAVTGITDLAIADGGTGASDAATARTNLGLGTAATVADSTLVHTSGNETIGGTKTFSVDASISGLTVGKGGSSSGTNSAFGISALAANTSYLYNTAIGYQAGQVANGSASSTFLGARAGQATTTGQVTFVGDAAGYANTTGTNNTAVGQDSLSANTTGGYNTVVGQSALRSNTTASNNTAVGYQAGYTNSTGTQNAFFGRVAGYANTTGAYNSVFGDGAFDSNTTGNSNTAIGQEALQANTTASNNTAVGYQAGYSHTTGTGGNTFLGRLSGYSTTGSDNTFVGNTAGYSMTTGTKNTIIGGFQGNQGGLDIRTASNYVVLSDGDGNPRQIIDNSGAVLINTVTKRGNISNDFNGSTANGVTINDTASAASSLFMGFYIGGSLIGNISRVASTSAVAYATTSDQRLKSNIADANPVLNKLMDVKVRQFDWTEGDLHQDAGFIAQELAPVLSGIVIEGKTEEDMWQLDYARLTPYLVKAIQEQQALITNLTTRLTALEGQ